MCHRPPCPEGRARQAGTHPGSGSSPTCTWRPQLRPRLLPLLKPAATGLTSGAEGAHQACAWRAQPKAALAGPAPGALRMGGAAPAAEAPSAPLLFSGRSKQRQLGRHPGSWSSSVLRVAHAAEGGARWTSTRSPEDGRRDARSRGPSTPFLFFWQVKPVAAGSASGAGELAGPAAPCALGRRRGSSVQHPEPRIGGATQLSRAQTPSWHDARVRARWARYRAPTGLGGQ
jgi:hypothetical protein